MKKISFLFVFLFILSGCSDDNSDEQAQKIMNDSNLNQEDVAIKSDNGNIDPNSFKDLTGQYKFATLKTNKGDIKVSFYADKSPKTVNNFLNLAQLGFYNSTKFHRVIKDFMIQGGDPNSKDDDRSNDGTGGPGYAFEDEFNDHKLVRGSLAMANAGPNTNGSQFFIVTAESTPWLDGHHTDFGEVVSGMDVVFEIEAAEKDQRDNPNDPIIINSIELSE